MRVLEIDGYRVYIYPNDCQQHHLAHCHVRRKNEEDTVVSLPELKVIVGHGINRKIRQFLMDHLDYLCNKWEELNPDC